MSKDKDHSGDSSEDPSDKISEDKSETDSASVEAEGGVSGLSKEKPKLENSLFLQARARVRAEKKALKVDDDDVPILDDVIDSDEGAESESELAKEPPPESLAEPEPEPEPELELELELEPEVSTEEFESEETAPLDAVVTEDNSDTSLEKDLENTVSKAKFVIEDSKFLQARDRVRAMKEDSVVTFEERTSGSEELESTGDKEGGSTEESPSVGDAPKAVVAESESTVGKLGAKFRIPKLPVSKISLPKPSKPKISIPKLRLAGIRIPKVSTDTLRLPKIKFPKVNIPQPSKKTKQKRQFEVPDELVSDADTGERPAIGSINVDVSDVAENERAETDVIDPDFDEPVSRNPIEEIQEGLASLDGQHSEAVISEPDSHSLDLSEQAAGALELAQLEQEKLAQEQAEKEKAEQERLEAERVEQARIAQESAEKEKAEQSRLEQERLEKEKAEQERLEAERVEQAQIEQENAEKEKAEQSRLEQERLEKEKAEQERLEAERVEQARIAQENAEKEKVEKEKVEKEKAEQARLEQERLEKEKAEQERLEAERVEQARIAQEKAEKEKAEQARLERERLEKEKAEQEYLEEERLEKEKLALELEQERLAEERLAQEIQQRKLSEIKELAELESGDQQVHDIKEMVEQNLEAQAFQEQKLQEIKELTEEGRQVHYQEEDDPEVELAPVKRKRYLSMAIAYYQIVAGVMLLCFVGIRDFSVLGFGGGVLLLGLSLFSVFCGYRMLTKPGSGFNVSFFNQFIQSIRISLDGVIFHYSCIGGVFFSLSHKGTVGIAPLFDPGFVWQSNVEISEYTVAVDLIVVFILFLLRFEEKKSLREQEKTES